MAVLKREQESHRMGMHTEQLAGRTQQIFFEPEAAENLVYPDAFDVDFNKRAEFDAVDLSPSEVNLKIREAQLQKIPYMLVVGQREADAGKVAVRHRKRGDEGPKPVEQVIARLRELVASKDTAD